MLISQFYSHNNQLILKYLLKNLFQILLVKKIRNKYFQMIYKWNIKTVMIIY